MIGRACMNRDLALQKYSIPPKISTVLRSYLSLTRYYLAIALSTIFSRHYQVTRPSESGHLAYTKQTCYWVVTRRHDQLDVHRTTITVVHDMDSNRAHITFGPYCRYERLTILNVCSRKVLGEILVMWISFWSSAKSGLVFVLWNSRVYLLLNILGH